MDRRVLKTVLMLAGFAAAHAYAENNGHGGHLSATLRGFDEVPLAIFSPGSGTVELAIDEQAGTINYTLSYTGLTTQVTQAHIHFGQKHVAGGVIAYFCSNLANAPAGTPDCPQFEGSVSGTISANSVQGLDTQNVSAGDFKALVSALRHKTGYANLHTTRFPAGELRGQLQRKDGEHAAKDGPDDAH
jgi:hypothetical protein